MTVEELEGKLTSIYHEFAETISENETDEQIVNRLCIVEVLTTLWYYKTWGASLPFMSRCPSGLRERSAKPFIYID